MVKVKVKCAWTSHEGILGEYRHSCTHSEPHHYMDLSGQLHAPAVLAPITQ